MNCICWIMLDLIYDFQSVESKNMNCRFTMSTQDMRFTSRIAPIRGGCPEWDPRSGPVRILCCRQLSSPISVPLSSMDLGSLKPGLHVSDATSNGGDSLLFFLQRESESDSHLTGYKGLYSQVNGQEFCLQGRLQQPLRRPPFRAPD
jgi:hypothetical protein